MAAAESPPDHVRLVLVSHSSQLAASAAALAAAMAPEVLVLPAGGVGEDPAVLGTDAKRVAESIQRAWSPAGVVVLMDLGSAVLSAELALELLPEGRRQGVRLSSAPLVEGAVAAAVAAQGGADVTQVVREAEAGLAGKRSQLGDAPTTPQTGPRGEENAGWRGLTVRVDLPMGLHARPAARVVQQLAGLDAEVRATNVTTGEGPVSARSLNALATLQVAPSQLLLFEARGADAEQVLGRLGELAGRAFDDLEEAAPAAPTEVAGTPLAPGVLVGLPASPGAAVGEVVHLVQAELVVHDRLPGPPQRELGSLEGALGAVREELRELRERTAGRSGNYAAAILDADLLFLDDPELSGRAREAISAGGVTAEAAWQAAAEAARASWERVADARLRLRAADLDGVARRVLAHLLGSPEVVPTGTGVLVAEDLTPADTAQLDPASVLGIATAAGGPTSHSAILARTLGIPAVVGVGKGLLELPAGRTVLLDGDRGVVRLDPTEEEREAVGKEAARRAEASRAASKKASRPARTRDGTAVEVAANIGSVADARAAVLAGADGVGLLRTEFLFQDRPVLPDEEAQFREYSEIAVALQGRPLTIRTLDVGADKPLASLPRDPEPNPALGVRGLRLGLARRDLLRTQLAAVARVAAEHRVRVMFPMVATVGEVRSARELLAALPAPDQRPGVPRLELGIMVEVPAAALAADRLAELVDFLSIGTNDLSQYTMAADRGNGGLRGLADPLHPAVLRLIQLTAAAATGARWAGVCGELAGDPLATELLIGLGVRELSAAPRLVPGVKEAVRACTLARARRLAERALQLPDADAVRELLKEPRR